MLAHASSKDKEQRCVPQQNKELSRQFEIPTVTNETLLRVLEGRTRIRFFLEGQIWIRIIFNQNPQSLILL